MAKHRIRRWLQFGVMDLLLLTTVVAIAAVLWRPVQARASSAPPCLFGSWVSQYDEGWWFMPDGVYRHIRNRATVVGGVGWVLTRHESLKNVFVLVCDDQRLNVRGYWGSGTLDVLDEDGK